MEQQIETSDKNVVISDGRFQDEVDLVKKYHGLIIGLKRDSIEKTSTPTHESEQLNLQVDVWIDNNGTLLELEANIIGAMMDHFILKTK